MQKPTDKQIREFLRESNKIEGVTDKVSLEDAMKAWKYLMKQSALRIPVILETHRILMEHQPIEAKYKGAFRDVDVYKGGKAAMMPVIIRNMVGDWCARAMDYRRMPDAKEMHVLYERIHPFIDGNGRTGRLLWNWMRLHRTGEGIIIIKDSDKQRYYRMFR